MAHMRIEQDDRHALKLLGPCVRDTNSHGHAARSTASAPRAAGGWTEALILGRWMDAAETSTPWFEELQVAAKTVARRAIDTLYGPPWRPARALATPGHTIHGDPLKRQLTSRLPPCIDAARAMHPKLQAGGRSMARGPAALPKTRPWRLRDALRRRVRTARLGAATVMDPGSVQQWCV
jgi:hypothetical protein